MKRKLGSSHCFTFFGASVKALVRHADRKTCGPWGVHAFILALSVLWNLNQSQRMVGATLLLPYSYSQMHIREEFVVPVMVCLLC